MTTKKATILGVVAALLLSVVSAEVIGDFSCKARNATTYRRSAHIKPVQHPVYPEGFLHPYTLTPTRSPELQPTSSPTKAPTAPPSTGAPVGAPKTTSPSTAPSSSPSNLPTSPPTSAPTWGGTCPMYQLNFHTIDCDNDPYITSELLSAFGVQIAAEGRAGGGYTPGGAARVFDTAFLDSSTGLASPHTSCGGLGVGGGGAVGATYSNCVPLGTAVLIQAADTSAPAAYADGGTLTFTFAAPVEFQALTLLAGADNVAASITLEYSDGTSYVQTAATTGANGVTREVLSKTNVVRIVVDIQGAAAVTDLEYRWCPPEDAVDALATVTLVKPPIQCTRKTVQFNALPHGSYVTNDLQRNYGCSIGAIVGSPDMGYTPNHAVRIMDSKNPFIPPSFKTPNENCDSCSPTIAMNRGCGSGDGGKPISPFHNCAVATNKVVVVAASAIENFDSAETASMRFKFEYLTYVNDITLMNVRASATGDAKPTIRLVDGAGHMTTIEAVPTGDNGIATVQLNVDMVREIWVNLPNKGGVMGLDYHMCSP